MHLALDGVLTAAPARRGCDVDARRLAGGNGDMRPEVPQRRGAAAPPLTRRHKPSLAASVAPRAPTRVAIPVETKAPPGGEMSPFDRETTR